MFKNREFAIRVRKADRNKDNNEVRDETIRFEDKVVITTNAVKTIVRNVAVGVCAYVVLDTARQVLVAQNTNPEED